MKTTPDTRPFAERLPSLDTLALTREQGEAKAQILREAYECVYETKRTPRQLAERIQELTDERAELIAALAEAVTYIQAGFPELGDDEETITISADDGPEATFHYAAALRLLSQETN